MFPSPSPRFRSDLLSERCEAGGAVYYDVIDPLTRIPFRMYEVEYLVARELDGQPLEAVARRVRDRIGLHTSVEELTEYTEKLKELGLLDLRAAPRALIMPPAPPGDGASHDNDAPSLAEMVMSEPVVISSGPTPLADVTQPSLPAFEPEPPQPPPPPLPRQPSIRITPTRQPRMPSGGVAVAARPRRGFAAPSRVLMIVVPLVAVAAVTFAIGLPSRRTTPPPEVRVKPAQAGTVMRFYPGQTHLEAVEPMQFAFAEAGRVAELLPPGQQVQAGDVLAKLDGYGKLQKAIEALRLREIHYQGELDKAERNGDPGATAHAKAKVQEKRTAIATLQARYGRYVLSSEIAGTVSENLAKVGDEVTVGQPVTSVVQPRLRADFVMPAADAAALKAGVIAQLASAGGALVDARVERADAKGTDVAVRVQVLENQKGVSAREVVRLVRARFERVVSMPADALVSRAAAQGQDRVYVVQDGKARQRVVTIVERTPKEALIAQGLAQGERVVVSGVARLVDGSPVQVR